MHLVFQNLHLTAVGNFLKFRIQIQIDRQTRINYLIKFAQNSHQKSRNCTCLPPARQPVRTCPSHAKSTQISCPPLPQPPPRIECPLNQSSISQTLRKRENSLSLSLYSESSPSSFKAPRQLINVLLPATATATPH